MSHSGTLFAFVASWTDGLYGRGSNGGVRVFRVDEATGELAYVSGVASHVNGGFLAIANHGRTLHVVDERKDVVGNAGGGSVLSFSIAPDDGALTQLSVVSTLGPNPSYISIDPSDSMVLTANHGNTYEVAVRINLQRFNLQSGTPRAELAYDDGTVTLFCVRPDGGLEEAVDIAVLDPSGGPDPVHQRASHPHSALFDPSGRFALVCDKGSDAIYMFRVLRSSPPRLELIARYDARRGVAPRHPVFHRSLPCVYVVNEQESSVEVLRFDDQRGVLRARQTVATAPPEVAGANKPSEVALHPSGRFLYASNRGADSIAAFSVDSSTGLLSELGSAPCGGHRPRGFTIEPEGRFLMVANTDSNCVTTIGIDQDSGRLSATSVSSAVPQPACIRFLRL